MGIDVKIHKTDVNAIIPTYAKEGDAGMDLYAIDSYVLQPMERRLFKTGLKMEIPFGYEGQVRPRSGNAVKYGITVLNTPGTVDCGYRGDVGVCLINLSTEPIKINVGDRIAQIVFKAVEYANVIEVNDAAELSVSERMEGGFGSTDKIAVYSEFVLKAIGTNSETQTVILRDAVNEAAVYQIPQNAFNSKLCSPAAIESTYKIIMDVVTDPANPNVQSIEVL